ncbi:beta-lactamase/transpeptidase-like protein [Verticillium dahliae]|nr:beta-lactamase/transpeptidase-like protein [Verticillium dahliae]
MLEVHYSPPRARDVDGETVYRVGSVSKVFAVLGAEMLAARGDLHLDDKVGRWIGELKEGSEGGVPWDEVTVGALATHMSGIGVDSKFDSSASVGNCACACQTGSQFAEPRLTAQCSSTWLPSLETGRRWACHRSSRLIDQRVRAFAGRSRAARMVGVL